MAFAVTDPGGHLVAVLRMDGAPWIATTVAQGKAWTSAAYGVPSAAQREKMSVAAQLLHRAHHDDRRQLHPADRCGARSTATAVLVRARWAPAAAPGEQDEAVADGRGRRDGGQHHRLSAVPGGRAA